ncbi:putative DNA binding domain-containing protein [Defluviimonas sp. D31]|uniref:RNA-binding domain-containing protein n=1 Tax=Defluviimonas sp. D31 TaxID=3083253 RepID=UPI00296FF117|nr:RNA-binding domain-containing protein [Defluviimonas sp. D31]MDW4551737.1 putative DNA binding domain-containing protein [Defluviimonas sp. D31]
MVDRAAIEGWCAKGQLPSQEDFFNALLDETELFTDIEGQHWDFKDQWPFSYSDSYFGGIARLICAFSNSGGGLIIFGVNDKTREGGKNRVRPNIDKLQLAFNQLTDRSFEFDFKTYTGQKETDRVDVLLVKPRARHTRPLRFNKGLDKYAADITWVRLGNEVQRAQPQHYSSLFISSEPDGVEGSIPPSSAQIKRFIGRVEAMTELFDWVQNSDEPRTYLYGKGGSGKTTIAREFARLVKTSGRSLKIEGTDQVDIVLFLSAKEKELVSVEAEIVTLDEPDFFDEATLLKKIIQLSGGEPDLDSTSTTNIQEYRKILLEYFDQFSYLIVVDDIDTLTTKGIDPGSDFLFRALSRAKKRSKILYTTRNAPSQSLHNSIEVPGLSGDDYEHFVDECVSRFKAPKPDKEFREIRLPKLSERRPLVIESIIALSRTAGGYEGAERLFSLNFGENVRDYVFSREWDSLSDGLERPLLAVLADLNKPATFEDIKIVLQAGDSTVRDAIGAVREMFLTVDDAGENALYSLAPLTRAFVNSKKISLKLYPAVKTRVQNYRKSIKITSPEVARLISRVRYLVPLRFSYHTDDKLRAALQIVRDSRLEVQVTEDPVFRSLRGYVESLQSRPNLPLVRDDFSYAIQMNHEPECEELMAWFGAEKRSGIIGDQLFKITDTVISGRKYTEDEKVGMISRKATTAYNLARQKLSSDPEISLKVFRDSLLLHLKAFKINALSGSPMLDVSEKYARNTSDQWFRLLSEEEKWIPLQSLAVLERDSDGYLDPISEPFILYLGRMTRSALFSGERARMHNQAKSLLMHTFDGKKWMDTTIVPRIVESLTSLVEATKVKK